MVVAKCQQTPLWNRFAKTAAPCDDTDSTLNAQWHGKCLLVVSRHHQLTPLIAALHWLCPVSPAVVHLLFRRRHWHSGRVIREMQQHMDVRGRFSNEFLHVCVQYLHREHHLIYLSLICCLYLSAPRSSWKHSAFWRLQEQITKHRVSSTWQRKESLEWRKFLFGEKSVQQSSWISFIPGCLPGLKTFTWCQYDLWLLNSPLKFVGSSRNCPGKPQEQRLETAYSMWIRANGAWASLWIYVLV